MSMSRERRAKSWGQALLIACLFVSRILGEEADTFSPVVSYQFQDSLSSEETTLISHVVSYQFQESLSSEETTLISPIVSYQYFDWLGDGNVTFQNSPAVSYFFNGPPRILSQPQPQVVKTGETATFSVTVEGSTPFTYVWQLNGTDIPSATLPTFQIPNAQPGGVRNYSVRVSNANGSAQSLSAALIVYDPAIGPPPALPTTTPPTVPIPPDLAKKAGVAPSSASLLTFGQVALISPTKMTVVMTHGWNADPFDWPIEMSVALKAKFGDSINIVAWDWHENALINPIIPSASASRTLAEGTALGQALMDTLGADYDHPIHFIGHSLGTFVNCAAANYIHGDKRPRGDLRSGSYYPSNTHMTLLDEASLVKAVGALQLVQDAFLGNLSKLTGGGNAGIATSIFQEVIPRRYRYVDAYSSAVGLPHAANTNVLLWRRHTVSGIEDFTGGGLHGYAYNWYIKSIETPNPRGLVLGSTLLGHAVSFENGTMGLAPSGGAFFQQSLDPNASPLAIAPISQNVVSGILKTSVLYPTSRALQGWGAIRTATQSLQTSAVQHTGSFVSNFLETFSAPAGTPIYSNTSVSTPAFISANAQTPYQPAASYNLQFTLSPQQASQLRSFAFQTNAEPPGNSLYSIIPTHVPREAVAVSFEFQITGGSTEEFMTMGIGEVNNFTMETKFVDDGVWNSVPAIPVTDFSDQDIDLVFALNGDGVAPTGSLGIRNIQFYIPPRPGILIEKANGAVKVLWPMSAVGWSLETSGDMSPGSWLPETTAPEVGDFFQSLKFAPTAPSKGFFRLRK